MGFLVMVAGAAAFGTSPVKVVQQAREQIGPEDFAPRPHAMTPLPAHVTVNLVFL